MKTKKHSTLSASLILVAVLSTAQHAGAETAKPNEYEASWKILSKIYSVFNTCSGVYGTAMSLLSSLLPTESEIEAAKKEIIKEMHSITIQSLDSKVQGLLDEFNFVKDKDLKAGIVDQTRIGNLLTESAMVMHELQAIIRKDLEDGYDQGHWKTYAAIKAYNVVVALRAYVLRSNGDNPFLIDSMLREAMDLNNRCLYATEVPKRAHGSGGRTLNQDVPYGALFAFFRTHDSGSEYRWGGFFPKSYPVYETEADTMKRMYKNAVYRTVWTANLEIKKHFGLAWEGDFDGNGGAHEVVSREPFGLQIKDANDLGKTCNWFNGGRFDHDLRVELAASDQIVAVSDFNGDGRDDLLLARDTGLVVMSFRNVWVRPGDIVEYPSSPFSTLDFVPFGRRLYLKGVTPQGWVLGKNDRIDLAGDFNGDGRGGVLVTSEWGIGVLTLDRQGKLAADLLKPNGTRFYESSDSPAGWLFDSRQNRLEGVLDITGDGKDDLVISSEWGVGILHHAGDTVQSFWLKRTDLESPPVSTIRSDHGVASLIGDLKKAHQSMASEATKLRLISEKEQRLKAMLDSIFR